MARLVDLSQYHHRQRAASGGEGVVRKMGEKAGVKQLFCMHSTDKCFLFLPTEKLCQGHPTGDRKHSKKLRKLNIRNSEKAMATHSSTLAWKVLWMEELVGCSPWGR